MDLYFVGRNIVVSSVGLPHEELVAYAREHFSNIPAEPPMHLRGKLSPQVRAYETTAHKNPSATAKWVGGMDLIEELPRTEALPPNYRPQTHVGIAFEGVSSHGDDMYRLQVLFVFIYFNFSFTKVDSQPQF
jgi:hypothetical protein